jgi:hypothetical protein
MIDWIGWALVNCQIIEVLPLRKRSGEMCEDLDRCKIYEVHPLNGLLRVSYFFQLWQGDGKERLYKRGSKFSEEMIRNG